MTQFIYLVILIGLPIALNIAFGWLMHHLRDELALCHVIRYMYGKLKKVEYNDSKITIIKKRTRIRLRIVIVIAMHWMFWLLCGFQTVSHIAALEANAMFWVITNRFIQKDVASGITEGVALAVATKAHRDSLKKNSK